MPALTLDSPVAALPRMRASWTSALRRRGVRTLRDLLLELPFGWEDFGQPKPIAELREGELATVVGTLTMARARRTPYKNLDLAEATLKDEAGRSLKLVWFHQSWRARQLPKGEKLIVAGEVKQTRFPPFLEMRNPEVQRLDGGQLRQLGGLTPKYHVSKGLTSRRVAELVAAALPLAEQLEEVLPEELRRRQRLLPVAEAVRQGHRPADGRQWQEARRRIAYAELYELQAAFAVARRRLALEPATPIPYRQEVIDAFKAGLGFELTQAQKRAIWDVYRDLQAGRPMNRLLNGDVGSGKTAVAAAAAAMAHAAGLQTVVMAPTEILARQHLQKFRAYLEASFPGLGVELLVSGLAAAERRRVRTAAASGHCALLVGTHALIEEDVELADLGLAVVDEQHRFGTRQRELLRQKGRGRPHFLAMTATPIPRTLALAVFGEMSLSVIDEMPPGRTPVLTEVVEPEKRQAAYDLVRREVVAGRQAFVICPLIEESEAVQARAVTVEFDRLKEEVFPDLRLGLVHGRLREKDAVMRDFREGAFSVLVATPVVEVGVDIPNATVMMVEGADRFGLAQLHQFRGRVGRGSLQSHCLLLADDPSEESLRRLQLVASVQDGFRLAEEDLRRRGMGELMGARQHGATDVAMEALEQPRLLDEVRQEAEATLAADPQLERSPALRQAILRRLELTSLS